MTAAKINKTCRMRDEDKRLCRRPKEHAIHGMHNAECTIAEDVHHDFVPAWRKYGEFKGDPFVRTSVFFRKSMLEYLKKHYGSIAVRLRELVFDDMAMPETRRRWMVGEDPVAREKKDDVEEPVV